MTNTLQLNSRKQSHLFPIGSCDKPSVYGIFFNMGQLGIRTAKYVNAICPCGKEMEVLASKIKNVATKFCSKQCSYKYKQCKPRFDLTGRKVGNWTVLSIGKHERNQYWWNVICSCGIKRMVSATSIINEKSHGCGIRSRHDENCMGLRENVEIKAGIYAVTNPLGEIYVGSSKKVYKRWIRHREANRKLKFHDSLRKYGWREHKWEIVEEHPLEVTEAELIVREQFYIDKFKAEGKVMLNVKDAGSSGKFPEESKRKMSSAQLGRTAWNKGLKNKV